MSRYFSTVCILFLFGCGNSYHYYSPPIKSNSFANPGEMHFSGHAGTNGSAAKLGAAINNEVSVHGTAHLSSPLKYRGAELEGALMFGRTNDSVTVNKNLTIGCGVGSNYEQSPQAVLKNFRGNFVKPFAMLTVGSLHREPAFGEYIFYDASFSIKANYLIYRGYKATSLNNFSKEKDFHANVFFGEPYFNFNIGTQWFRIDWGLGLIIKKKYEFDRNISIFPIESNIGALFILGRKGIK